MNQTFNDTYEIKSLIGKGGMSAVYLAEHKRLHTRWAVKQVYKRQAGGFDFLAESNILKKLQHPMLPRIVDIFEDEDNVYVVEDFVEGITLEDWLKEHQRVPEEQGTGWFKDLCGVLEYLHSRKPNPIVYRDMKPSNIMLQPDGTLKLIDFGIAREYKQEATADATYIGTKGYAAPEQFGKAQTDERTDIYSLGVTMYHLLTGKSPYEPPYQFVPARQLVAQLSPGMEYILSRCVQPEPADRYQNVEQLLDDLEHSYRFDQAYQKVVRTKKLRVMLVTVMFLASLALMGSGWWVMGREAVARENQITAQYEQMLQDSQTLLNTDPQAALEQIQAARQLRPERVESYRQEAYYLYRTGGYEECVNYVRQQLETFPGDGELTLILASASYELGDYETAAESFYQGAQSSDMDEGNLRDYAVCLARLDRTDEAQTVLEQLSAAGASSEVTDYVRGELYYAQQEYDQAEEAFQSVLKQTEDSGLRRRCYMALAETYRDSLRYDDSIAIIQQALTQPELQGNTVLYEMLGAAYYNRGVQSGSTEDLTQAAEYFTRVTEAGVAKEYLYVNAFTAWQSVGQYTNASQVLDRMEETYPNSYVPHALRATLYILIENTKAQDQRNYAPAVTEYEQAVALAGGSDTDTTYLQQLEGLMAQLRSGGWLN